MFPPFNQELARHYCLELISSIESGVFSLKQISQISEERSGQGIMLGCLVSYDYKKNQRIILYAVSGISKKIYKNNKLCLNKCFCINGNKIIFVPDIVDSKKIKKALRKNDKKIHELTYKINQINKHINQIDYDILYEKRKKLCFESLKNVFAKYKFTRFDGTKISLKKIINTSKNFPPTGTGDCCAPKLLNYAFSKDLTIISMDEVYYGGNTKNKENLKSYEPCDERCGYILPSILGLKILYRDSQIVIIDKQSGLLSVPGKGKNRFDSAEQRIYRIYKNNCISQSAVHRLDMETSGLLIFALTKESLKNLYEQFEKGLVHKKYIAVLDGILENAKGNNAPGKSIICGQMELKFRLDVNNRPYQIYDEINGKIGITEWKKEGTILYKNPFSEESKRCTIVSFIPHTGRTHQLRLASSDIHGFGLPIVGDSLYGECKKGERLLLHSSEVEFFHPVSGKKLKFTSKPDFI